MACAMEYSRGSTYQIAHAIALERRKHIRSERDRILAAMKSIRENRMESVKEHLAFRFEKFRAHLAGKNMH